MKKQRYGGGIRSCARKKRHETYQEAKQAAKALRKQVGPKVRPYLCTRCGAWHNGHDRKKRFYAGKYRLPDREVAKT